MLDILMVIRLSESYSSKCIKVGLGFLSSYVVGIGLTDDVYQYMLFVLILFLLYHLV